MTTISNGVGSGEGEEEEKEEGPVQEAELHISYSNILVMATY